MKLTISVSDPGPKRRGRRKGRAFEADLLAWCDQSMFRSHHRSGTITPLWPASPAVRLRCRRFSPTFVAASPPGSTATSRFRSRETSATGGTKAPSLISSRSRSTTPRCCTSTCCCPTMTRSSSFSFLRFRGSPVLEHECRAAATPTPLPLSSAPTSIAVADCRCSRTLAFTARSSSLPPPRAGCGRRLSPTRRRCRRSTNYALPDPWPARSLSATSSRFSPPTSPNGALQEIADGSTRCSSSRGLLPLSLAPHAGYCFATST